MVLAVSPSLLVAGFLFSKLGQGTPLIRGQDQEETLIDLAGKESHELTSGKSLGTEEERMSRLTVKYLLALESQLKDSDWDVRQADINQLGAIYKTMIDQELSVN